MYAESKGLNFGGWIVVDKSSGKIKFVDAPDDQKQDRDAYLGEASKVIEALMSNYTYKTPPLSPEDEAYVLKGERIKTGNKILNKVYRTFCGYRKHCWPDAVQHPKVTSRARACRLVSHSKGERDMKEKDVRKVVELQGKLIKLRARIMQDVEKHNVMLIEELRPLTEVKQWYNTIYQINDMTYKRGRVFEQLDCNDYGTGIKVDGLATIRKIVVGNGDADIDDKESRTTSSVSK